MKPLTTLLAGLATVTLMAAPALAQTQGSQAGDTHALQTQEAHEAPMIKAGDTTGMTASTDQTMLAQFSGTVVMSSDNEQLGTVSGINTDAAGDTWLAIDLDPSLGADSDTAFMALNTGETPSDGKIDVNMTRDDFVAAVKSAG
jgi:hypothetical protein